MRIEQDKLGSYYVPEPGRNIDRRGWTDADLIGLVIIAVVLAIVIWLAVWAGSCPTCPL